MSNSFIPSREIETRAYALLQCTHALNAETDRIAGLLADLLGVDPSSDVITDAVWNTNNPAEAVMYLKGELPAPGRPS